MGFVDLREIVKIYPFGGSVNTVLHGVSLAIRRGEYVAVMGSSGSGKTTLMNILGCLDRPTSGSYRLEGLEVTAMSPAELARLRHERIGFVFQTFNLLPRTSALDNVLMPLSYGRTGVAKGEARRRAGELLRRVGLGDHLHHEPSQLSGGQQQRVAIARALINEPALLLADEPTGNLDSRTSEEVLRIFRDLNGEGVTVVLVTHDEAVAEHARRIVRIRDGLLESDTASPSVAPESEVLEVRSPHREENRDSGASRSLSAGPLAMLRTALTGLRRNVMRAALTTLGIVIGVAAVIAMMEIGKGSATAIQKTIAGMGANHLLILPGAAASGGVTHGAGTILTLTPDDAEAIAREVHSVRAVAPVVRARTQVVCGNRNWMPNEITGTTPAYLDVREWEVWEGEAFSDQDVRNANRVCLLGRTIARELFQGEDPVGREVRINSVPFRVTGVLAPKGANMMGMDQDDTVLAPWTTIKFRVAAGSQTNSTQAGSGSGGGTVGTAGRLYPGSLDGLYPGQTASQAANTPMPTRFSNVDRIHAAAVSPSLMSEAIREMTGLLRDRHRIRPGQLDDFNIRDMTEMTRAMASTADMMTRLLLTVALISLVVGGVGIMNIMLVSVTERTREIGLRMAVGARPAAILQQFLMESVLLCVCGGAAGILVGRGASRLVTVILRWPTEVSLEAVLAAFAVSATVGIVFGYYPAWKASRLDPINALRYE